MSLIKLKLNFLKRVLTDAAREDVKKEFFRTKQFPAASVMEEEIKRIVPIFKKLGEESLDKIMEYPLDSQHTLIGLDRLDNLEDCLDHMMDQGVEGDFMETGIWRGGACIFVKKYFDLYGIDKKIYACDSFVGLPGVDMDRYPEDATGQWEIVPDLTVSKSDVIKIFELYGCLDDNVIFIEGWFKDTLKGWDKPIGVLRMDGDMYQSTMDTLKNVHPKVEKNGIIIVDDYCILQCREAVHDYFDDIDKIIIINEIDRNGVWFLNKEYEQIR